VKRILVTGNAGSGKSTLAQRIAADFGLPCHSLDRIVWQSGWKKTPQDEKARRIQNLIKQESWVIDGVSSQAQSHADVVIFLDVPRSTSLWRVAKRNWRFLFRSRPELPSGCPEILIIPSLLKIIWRFPKAIRPRILEQMSENSSPKRNYRIRNQSELETCLAALKTETNPNQPRRA